MAGVFDPNVKLDAIARNVAQIRWGTTMRKKRKRRRTIDELLGPQYRESHERAQRLLTARIEYHERKLAEERSAGRQSG
jgi:hypothetical protein